MHSGSSDQDKMNRKDHQTLYRVRKLDHQNWHGNSQGATNCEDCEFDSNIVFEDGIPVEYNCNRQVQADWDLSETIVQFDYEATIPIGLDVEKNKRLMNWSLLNTAAESTGLNPGCDFEKQYDSVEHHHRHHRHSRLLAPLNYPTTIYALETTPLDDTHEGGCVSLEYNSETSECLPLRAHMRVRYRGSSSDDRSIQEYIEDLIQQFMAEKPSPLIVGNVLDISYIGDRTIWISKNDVNQLSDEPEALDSGNNMMAPLISVSTVAVLGIIFLFSRRRKGEQKEVGEKSGPVDLDDIADLEAGSTGTSDVSCGFQKTDSEVTIGNNESYDAKPSVILIAETGENSSTKSTQEVTNQDLQRTTSRDSTEAIITVAEAGVPPLPPRPPMGPRRNSQKLKKRRRRKKKKKKTTLKRVNSRENVDKMDSIRESDQEGSKLGSECDSEYTWSDDDGSSNMSSSGCLTPVHSKSLADSRASSPRLSPQDKLFPSDVFANFDFVIEAPDFPFGPNGEESKPYNEEKLKPRTASSKPPKDMVSPIKEETIRPIPPPWV